MAYNPDTRADIRPAADALARLLGQGEPHPDPTVAPGHLRLVLGTDFTTPPELTQPQPANPRDTDPTTDTTSDTSPSPGSGGLPAANLHTDGVPCVK